MLVPALLTVEEFSQLPELPGVRQELHHGEVVRVSPPPHDHKRLQRRLRMLLAPLAERSGLVCDTDYAYRPLPEHELWVADVVCIETRRDDEILRWLEGSPEVVIEIRSRSNTRHQLLDKAMTTLAGAGSVEFWIVDPASRSIAVYTKTSGIHVYGPGSAVPLPFSEGQTLPADEVFASPGV